MIGTTKAIMFFVTVTNIGTSQSRSAVTRASMITRTTSVIVGISGMSASKTLLKASITGGIAGCNAWIALSRP